MDTFQRICKSNKLPIPEPEYRFCPERKWRFDYAFIEQKIAIECEGGVWSRGRHTRPSGFIKDMEKYNRAALLGWRVLRYTPAQMLTDATDNLKIIFSKKCCG